jgi:drug/metabolite transporter (DMT)-like permease
LHWSLRLVFGLFFILCALACLVGSCVLIFDPQSHNPLLAQISGIVMALLSVWVLSVAIRLLRNRPNRGGLLSPLTLRLVAIYMAAMPTFLLVTGRSSSWTLLQYLQAGIFIFGAFGIWRLAAWRQASNVRA